MSNPGKERKSNNSMQRNALRAAAEAERWRDKVIPVPSEPNAHSWFRHNLGFATLLVVATVGATYAVVQVLVVHQLQRDRDDAHARVERLEGEKSTLATESGKLQAQIDALDRQAGEGESSYGALRKALTNLEQSQDDIWEAINSIQSKLQAPVDTEPPRREFIRTQVDTTQDRCSEDLVTVEGRDGPITLRKGDFVEIPLSPTGEVFWSCGSTRERTATASGADIAILSRDREGRAMTWLFYKTEPR